MIAIRQLTLLRILIFSHRNSRDLIRDRHLGRIGNGGANSHPEIRTAVGSILIRARHFTQI
jgi:hypothetical protein